MENCGQGHDVTQICCAHAELVQTRLRAAEDALRVIDTLTVLTLASDREAATTAQRELGNLLFDRVKEQVARIWAAQAGART